MTESRPAFVKLAVIGDVMAARILVARLAAEGIEARVPGEGLGPYRLTVGELASVEIWVEEGQVDAARQVLLAAEIDALEPSSAETRRIPIPAVVLGGIALLIVIASRLLAAVN